MILRALAVWLVILVLANLNGALREFWLIPGLGEPAGRVVSTVTLCVLIVLITWLAIASVWKPVVGAAGRLRPAPRAYLGIGSTRRAAGSTLGGSRDRTPATLSSLIRLPISSPVPLQWQL